jgi:hypothetical protein
MSGAIELRSAYWARIEAACNALGVPACHRPRPLLMMRAETMRQKARRELEAVHRLGAASLATAPSYFARAIAAELAEIMAELADGQVDPEDRN